LRVTRAQAEENRRTVVATAGRLFREHGFDGIGLSDLMSAAGLTHGGFYKQFGSKEDLQVEACDSALAASAEKWNRMIESGEGDPLAAIVGQYLSRAHRDNLGEGCAFAALGADASRHNKALLRSFEAGIKSHLDVLQRAISSSSPREAQNDAAVALSTMVGALLLSRTVQDEALSRKFLDAAAGSLLERRRARRRRKPAK
jgi:TetR/AcrR family transcriptional regulator, transcriptional repressor for nem operon